MWSQTNAMEVLLFKLDQRNNSMDINDWHYHWYKTGDIVKCFPNVLERREYVKMYNICQKEQAQSQRSIDDIVMDTKDGNSINSLHCVQQTAWINAFETFEMNIEHSSNDETNSLYNSAFAAIQQSNDNTLRRDLFAADYGDVYKS